MLTVRQLKYFITIVDHGSVTKASLALGIAQPSVGFQIRKLEETIQAQVLNRSTSGVTMTSAGEILYERARSILADVENLERELKEFANAPVGRVSLGIAPSLADRLLVPLIKRMNAEFPALELNVSEDLSQHLIDQLEAGRIDIGLAFNLPAVRGVHTRQVGAESAYLIYHSSEADPDSSPISFRNLSEFGLALPQRPHRIREMVDNVAHKLGVKLKIDHEMQSLGSIIRMVESGLAATIIAGSRSNRQTRTGTMVARQIIEPELKFDISLFYQDARSLSQAETAVVHLIDELTRELF